MNIDLEKFDIVSNSRDMSVSKGRSNSVQTRADLSVECPICTLPVPESDINLHLDLQCPGVGSSSKFQQTPARPSSRAINTSQDSAILSVDDVVVVPDDTQTQKSGQRGVEKRDSVAPIFGTREKRRDSAVTENMIGRDMQGELESSMSKSSQKRASEEGQTGTEKKPRPNPLTANQPCVLPTNGDLLLTHNQTCRTVQTDIFRSIYRSRRPCGTWKSPSNENRGRRRCRKLYPVGTARMW